MSQEKKPDAILKEIRKRDREDLARALQTDFGRRLLWRVLFECDVFGDLRVQSADVHYRIGKRDVGIWLLRQIEGVDPSATWQLAREALVQKELIEAEEKS